MNSVVLITNGGEYGSGLYVVRVLLLSRIDDMGGNKSQQYLFCSLWKWYVQWV